MRDIHWRSVSKNKSLQSIKVAINLIRKTSPNRAHAKVCSESSAISEHKRRETLLSYLGLSSKLIFGRSSIWSITQLISDIFECLYPGYNLLYPRLGLYSTHTWLIAPQTTEYSFVCYFLRFISLKKSNFLKIPYKICKNRVVCNFDNIILKIKKL